MNSEMGDVELIPPDVKFSVEPTVRLVVPEKSKQRYELMYDGFVRWQNKNDKGGIFTEEVFLSYFKELAAKNAPSSLWATYSMLRTMIHVHHKVDMAQYYSVTGFLRQQAKGYKPKQAKVFENEDIARFLNEAPDSQYLATKVVAIFGIAGGCKTSELMNVSIQDVERHGNLYLVKIRTIPAGVTRTFTISNDNFRIVQSYINLRPKNVKTNRFFLNYQNQKCTIQPIGKNKIGKMPEEIATYLQLSEPSQYTGHSFRRTSNKVLKNSGTHGLTVKKLGDWIPTSTHTTDTFVENGEQNNLGTEPLITISVGNKPPTYIPIGSQELNNNTGRNQDPLGPETSEINLTDDMDHSNEVDYSDDTTYSDDRLDFELDNELNNSASERSVENGNCLQQNVGKISSKRMDLSNLKNVTFNNCSYINIYPWDAEANSTNHVNNYSKVDFSDDTTYSDEILNFDLRDESNNINRIKSEKPGVSVNFTQENIGKISSSKMDLSNRRNITFNNCSHINIYLSK